MCDAMLKKTHDNMPRLAVDIQQSQPLWQRVPTRTDAGEYVCDFMMLISRFNQLTSHTQNSIVEKLYAVLKHYSDVVIFADLNVKLNLLWISYRPRPGIGLEVAAMIHEFVPEAKLVSHHQRQT